MEPVGIGAPALGKWADVERFLARAFAGRARKCGSPMVWHSVRIGRELLARGCDDITVFGGYCHDVLEDVTVVDGGPMDAAALLRFALTILETPADAEEAVRLVEECSYSDAEYLMAKKDRKAAACARWIASDNPRLALVKIADVEDNWGDVAQVSQAFEAEYRAWADPLHAGLTAVVAARSRGLRI